ncbi:MAG: hypothetical protein LBD84_07630 [Campylobacteraceae bacterium]|jgi:hypothetical protein|nr:hypothetical protein [Campylobacteraceae bacterium]
MLYLIATNFNDIYEGEGNLRYVTLWNGQIRIGLPNQKSVFACDMPLSTLFEKYDFTDEECEIVKNIIKDAA